MNANEMISKLIGLTKDAAIAMIVEGGLISRVAEEDGKPNILTCELRQDRINLTINGGKIIKADVG